MIYCTLLSHIKCNKAHRFWASSLSSWRSESVGKENKRKGKEYNMIHSCFIQCNTNTIYPVWLNIWHYLKCFSVDVPAFLNEENQWQPQLVFFFPISVLNFGRMKYFVVLPPMDLFAFFRTILKLKAKKIKKI